LELAAKAAEIAGEFRTERMCLDGDWEDVTAIFPFDPLEGWWNPLTDDGDAFRLMSDLRLSAFLSEKLQNAHVYAHYQNPASPGVGIVSGGLSAELLRRAIVEAAAQIGRACTSGEAS